jgi:predicted small integral membrane protein
MKSHTKKSITPWHVYLRAYFIGFFIFFSIALLALYILKVVKYFIGGAEALNLITGVNEDNITVLFIVLFISFIVSALATFYFWLERTHRQGYDKFRCFIVVLLIYIFCFCRPILYFFEEYQVSHWGHCFVFKKGCLIVLSANQ